MDNKVLLYSGTDSSYIAFGSVLIFEFILLILLSSYGIYKSFKLDSSFTVISARLILIPLLLFCLSNNYLVAPLISFRKIISFPKYALRTLELIQVLNFSSCLSQVLYTIADIYLYIKKDGSTQKKQKILFYFKFFLFVFLVSQIIFLASIAYIENNPMMINKDFYFNFIVVFFTYSGVLIGIFFTLIILLHVKINKIIQSRTAEKVKRNMKIYTIIPIIVGMTFVVSYIFSDNWENFSRSSRYSIVRAGIYFLMTNFGCIFPVFCLIFIVLKGLDDEIEVEISIVNELLSGISKVEYEF